MRTLQEKAAAFRDLHLRERAFIVPNPWNVGSARILPSLGFEAIATTAPRGTEPVCSSDADPNHIRGPAVDHQHDVGFALTDQAAIEAKIDLIESRENSLGSGIKHFDIRSGDARRDSGEHASTANARAE